ncbi:MAG: nuclear transport factor 2 family protein [Proteobacteria bacterium]|nr:nuclear transport factor 2 family protein [Pseudomonadota bacterium]MDA1355243.1 nuclear transport factor 2 family protein [Pseudomonadota bacterium]
MRDEQAVLQANQAFYTAFATRDLAAMEQIWAHEATICCIHPGWAPLVGRAPVIESWAAILSDPGAPEISCGDASAILHHQSALVMCHEYLPQGHLLASNFFVLENNAWHLVHHHAGPGPQIAVASSMRPDGGTVH